MTTKTIPIVQWRPRRREAGSGALPPRHVGLGGALPFAVLLAYLVYLAVIAMVAQPC